MKKFFSLIKFLGLISFNIIQCTKIINNQPIDTINDQTEVCYTKIKDTENCLKNCNNPCLLLAALIALPRIGFAVTELQRLEASKRNLKKDN
jgi:hypothetical protein